MNRHGLSFFLFSILILFSVSSALSAEKFVVSGNPNAPPVIWEENKKLVGFAPDLTSSIFNLLGIKYNIEYFGNWQDVQNSAKEMKVDMLISAYKNNERSEYLLFSEPYLSQPTVIIVKKGNEFKLSSWNALIGKKGVSNIGESYGEDFDQFLKSKLDVSFHPFERAIQLLSLNEADYLIADLYTALIYMRLLQGEDSVSILDPPVSVQSFHLAIHKDSPLSSYLPDINNKINDKIKSGEIKNLFLIHFDKWKQLIDRRNHFLSNNRKSHTERNEAYLKKQDEMARQRIIKTMTDREGLPKAAK